MSPILSAFLAASGALLLSWFAWSLFLRRHARAQWEKAAHADRLVAIFASAPDGVIACDRSWKIYLANAAAERVFGFRPGELAGRCLDAVVPPDQTLDCTGEEMVLAGRRKDGSSFPLQFSIGEVSVPGDDALFIITVRDITERKKTEQALRESEERYRELFETSSDLIYMADNKGRIEYVNQTLLDALGYSTDGLPSLTLRDLVDPERAPGDIPRLLGSGVEWMETQFVTTRGRRILVEGRTARRIENGAVIGTRGVFRDMTAYRRAEDALERMRRQNEMVLHAAGNGIYGCDAMGQTTFVNPAAADMLGLAETDFFLTRCDDVFRARNADATPVPQHESDLWITIRTGQTIARDDREFACSDGSWLPVSYVVSPVIDGGQVAGAVLTFSDITARREAEARRTASERRLQSLLDNMLGGLITTNARGIITYVNPGAEAIFGYSREQILGKTVDVLLAERPDDLRDFLRTMGPKALGRVTEWVGRRGDGASFPFELALFQFDAGGRVEYAASIRDLSERKHVELLKQQFLASVSHELRTPLTSVRGSLALVAAGVLGELPEEASEMLGIADRNAARLEHLINDILDYERLSSGRFELVIAPAAVQDIFDRSAEVLESFATSSGVEVGFRPTPLWIAGDTRRLVQVLVNLAANAVKFSAAGSKVDVDALRIGDEVIVRVRDRGRGIPSECIEKIFEPFSQVEADDWRTKGGAGLGLTISRSLVEQHGGAIGVVSALGEGSTFWFRVPAAPGVRLTQEETSAPLLMEAMVS